MLWCILRAHTHIVECKIYMRSILIYSRTNILWNSAVHSSSSFSRSGRNVTLSWRGNHILNKSMRLNYEWHSMIQTLSLATSMTLFYFEALFVSCHIGANFEWSDKFIFLTFFRMFYSCNGLTMFVCYLPFFFISVTSPSILFTRKKVFHP